MALNTPWCAGDSIDEIIAYHLQDLTESLRKMKIEVDVEDFDYEFFNRCESLALPSSLLYPNEDLPKKFGVYRGYAGGGIHSSLQRTEIDRLPKNRQAKANRILDLFQAKFWSILKDVDRASEAESGEDVEAWDSVAL